MAVKKKTFRVVTRGEQGQMHIRDYPDIEALQDLHMQVGIDDCSTDLSLRGLPLFRGLIGPMSEDKTIVRYESPDVFEEMTKEWTATKPKRRTRRRKPAATAATEK